MSREDRIPNSRRSGIFEVERCEIELTLANAMHQLDACNRGCGAPEPLEAKHDLGPGLDVAMVLLYQVVQVLRRSDLGVRGQQAVRLHLPHGAVRGRIAIERDGFRWMPLMLDDLLEKCLCCCHVAFGAEHEVYRLACPINRPIEIDPPAADLQVRFVDTPRLSRRRAKTVPTFDEFGRITLHPTQDRRVRERQTTLNHHLDKIPQAKLVAQVPANTQKDDLAIKVSPIEQLVQALQLTHRPSSVRVVRRL